MRNLITQMNRLPEDQKNDQDLEAMYKDFNYDDENYLV